MAEQMAHLHNMTQTPNVDIQVLPFTAGAHAAGTGHFIILGKDDQQTQPLYGCRPKPDRSCPVTEHAPSDPIAPI